MQFKCQSVCRKVERVSTQKFVDHMHNIDLNEVEGNHQLTAGLRWLAAERFYLCTNGARSYAKMVLSLKGDGEYFSPLFYHPGATFVSKHSAGSLGR